MKTLPPRPVSCECPPRIHALDLSIRIDDHPAFLRMGGHSVRVSVVVPALNEAENLPHVLPRIPSWVHEVILVDGYSIDGTIEVARNLWPDIRVVMQDGKGKGAALRTGFEAATGDIIVMLDADGSTDPAEIPSFVGALLAGADFVKGSRFLQGGGTADMSFYRRMGNWGFIMLVRALFGGYYSDLCYGYNAFWTDAVRILKPDGDGFEIETMLNVRALRMGLKVTEVASFEALRVYGTSHLRTIPDGWRVLKTIFSEWRASWRTEAVEAPELRRRVSLPEVPLAAARARFVEAATSEAKVVVA